MAVEVSGFYRVATLSDLGPAGRKVVSLAGRHILLVRDGAAVRALDSRCPHMGYPLIKGSIRDGVLRCHWHHWRFDMASGGCFTEGGDDVATFAVELRGEEIWVGPDPARRFAVERERKAYADLAQGMEERNTFLIAKAVAALNGQDASTADVLRAGALAGIRYRRQGFGPGLTILTCMGRLLPALRPEDRPMALVHGLLHTARDAFGGPPRRMLRPLPDGGVARAQLTRWFRLFAEDRESAGMERCLRTAIAGGSRDQVLEMALLAVTDHYFLSTGHVLDFLNKAFELLDLIGAADAEDVLSSIVPAIASAHRHEEDADWSEMVEPLEALFAELPALIAERRGGGWRGEDELVQILLQEEPSRIIAAVREAVASGATPRQLARCVARAGIHRVARFHVQNEEDWDDVLHVISYANALDALAARAGDTPETAFALIRAACHGAMFVYLTHFLNIPRAKLPSERDWLPARIDDPAALCERLLYCAEFQQVEEAAGIVHHYQERGYPIADLKAAIGRALLREDSAFHTFQMVDAGFRQHAALGPHHPDGRLALVAATRYMVAQKLRRNVLWSTQNALKMARGEGLEGE